MHYWNIEALAQQLRGGQINEWQRTRYLIASFLIPLAWRVLEILASDPSKSLSGLGDLLSVGASAAIYFFGLIFAFNIHTRTGQMNFVEKVICFNLPATLRALAYGLGSLLFLGMLLAPVASLAPVSASLPYLFAPLTAFLYIYFVIAGFRALGRLG